MRKNFFNRRMLGNLLVRWCEGLRLISNKEKNGLILSRSNQTSNGKNK
ncbi:hypothetical protein [Texas Phoenix palm phytoplasma]|nr:hypothetical protein [Texas Phoenix palm phytoplasma]